VTVDKNSDYNYKAYEFISDIIHDTLSTDVTDQMRPSLIPGPYPFGTSLRGPAGTPVTYYGTLNVIP